MRAFSGRAADSVLQLVDGEWARLGRSDVREARFAWRRRNGVPEVIGDSFVEGPRLTPNYDLESGDGSVAKPAPRIISHYEALHFGRRDKYSTVPGGVEAEMVFIGDAGDVQLGSLAITRTTGPATVTSYPPNGKIASGPGELINCGDAIFGVCENRRHLGGVVILDGAPFCDAKATGNVSYYANTVAVSIGLTIPNTPLATSTNGTSNGSVATSAYLDNTAPACDPIQSGDDNGGQQMSGGSEPASGSPSGPSPQPWEPPPTTTPEPPPPIDSGPTTFYCSSVTMYQYVGDQQIYLADATVCYRG